MVQVDDLLAKSAENSALNNKKRLATSYSNFARRCRPSTLKPRQAARSTCARQQRFIRLLPSALRVIFLCAGQPAAHPCFANTPCPFSRTVTDGTCKFPGNWFGCDVGAVAGDVKYVSDDIKLGELLGCVAAQHQLESMTLGRFLLSSTSSGPTLSTCLQSARARRPASAPATSTSRTCASRPLCGARPEASAAPRSYARRPTRLLLPAGAVPAVVASHPHHPRRTCHHPTPFCAPPYRRSQSSVLLLCGSSACSPQPQCNTVALHMRSGSSRRRAGAVRLACAVAAQGPPAVWALHGLC